MLGCVCREKTLLVYRCPCYRKRMQPPAGGGLVSVNLQAGGSLARESRKSGMRSFGTCSCRFVFSRPNTLPPPPSDMLRAAWDSASSASAIFDARRSLSRERSPPRSSLREGVAKQPLGA